MKGFSLRICLVLLQAECPRPELRFQLLFPLPGRESVPEAQPLPLPWIGTAGWDACWRRCCVRPLLSCSRSSHCTCLRSSSGEELEPWQLRFCGGRWVHSWRGQYHQPEGPIPVPSRLQWVSFLYIPVPRGSWRGWGQFSTWRFDVELRHLGWFWPVALPEPNEYMVGCEGDSHRGPKIRGQLLSLSMTRWIQVRSSLSSILSWWGPETDFLTVFLMDPMILSTAPMLAWCLGRVTLNLNVKSAYKTGWIYISVYLGDIYLNNLPTLALI